MRVVWLSALSSLLFCLYVGLPAGVAAAGGSRLERKQDVLPLPGGLDDVPVFNSNSPEVVQEAGILISTFPPETMEHPTAHLNKAFEGRFDVFAHHIAKAAVPEDFRTLYLGVLLHNPGDEPIDIKVLQGATYLSQPDAPFIELPAFIENDAGAVYAGPGGRVAGEVLRGARQAVFPEHLRIPAGGYSMLLNAPIPVRNLKPPLNGRSALIRLDSSGPVYVASLAMFRLSDDCGGLQPPTLGEWINLLKTSGLAGPRDKSPTRPGAAGPIVYGRVAGVTRGSRWIGTILQHGKSGRPFVIPERGRAISFVLSSVRGGTFGTGQIQSAPMLARYPDTAYEAHGNYGVEYDLTIPLVNRSDSEQMVRVALETPLKSDTADGKLAFLVPPDAATFFRGTVMVSVAEGERETSRFIHLVQKRGQIGFPPLAEFSLSPGESATVDVRFIYPPDATPPQVLTISTHQGQDAAAE